jgi:hypothetical protein
MALTQTQVSQLYVAIFNRASEGSGNAYWQTQGDMAAVATAMLATPDAQTYFGDSLDSDQAFIEHIYLNTLNKTVEDDADGIAYWVGQLEAGATRGAVVAALVEAIESYGPDGENYDPEDAATVAAYTQFTNRVEVSNYMADNVTNPPANYAQSTAFDKDLVVTDDAATVTSAKAAVDVLAQDDDPGEAGESYYLTAWSRWAVPRSTPWAPATVWTAKPAVTPWKPRSPKACSWAAATCRSRPAPPASKKSSWKP